MLEGRAGATKFEFVRETVVVDGKHIGSYSYTEFGSKNRQGGFDMLNMQNKVVQQHENESNLERCHVRILDKYLSLLLYQKEEKLMMYVFYLTPLPCRPEPGKLWYVNTPVG